MNRDDIQPIIKAGPASMMEKLQQLGMRGIEQQQQGIQDTQAQIERLRASQPDPQKQQQMKALFAAADFLSDSGGKASQLHQLFQPQDQSKALEHAERSLAAQRQGLSKSEMDLLKAQMTAQSKADYLKLAQRQANAKAAGAGAGGMDVGDLLKLKRIEEIDARLGKGVDAKKANATATTNLGQVMIRDINTAVDTIDQFGNAAAGWGGLTGAIPGTPAHRLKNDLDSVQGTVAIDQLLQIKKSGAGLGQVPQSQLEMLASLMGSIRQTTDPQKLKSNLRDIESIYSDIVAKEGGDPHKLYKQYLNREQNGGVLPGDGGGVTAPQGGAPDFDNMSDEELLKYVGN